MRSLRPNSGAGRAMPVLATFLGIHAQDGRLADLSREPKLAQIEAERRFVSGRRGARPGGLSPVPVRARARAPRPGARVFDDEEQRVWERRASASDEIGDGLFSSSPASSRRSPSGWPRSPARLEAAPASLAQARDRLGAEPVRLWNEMELEIRPPLPSFFAEILAGWRRTSGRHGGPAKRRLEAAVGRARRPGRVRRLAAGRLADATDDFALGPEGYEHLVRLRALDGLDATTSSRSACSSWRRTARRGAAAAREVDADATEAEVLARIKKDHPATFERGAGGVPERDVAGPRAHRSTTTWPRCPPARR